MRCLLDTNIVIFVFKDQIGKAPIRLSQESPSDVVVCAVVEAERYHGATKYGVPDRRSRALDGFLAPFPSLPFDSACVPHYAHLRDATYGVNAWLANPGPAFRETNARHFSVVPIWKSAPVL